MKGAVLPPKFRVLMLSGALFTIFSGNATQVFSQTKPVDFVLGSLPVTSSESYSISGFGPNSGTNYYTGRTYHLNFGKSNDVADGFNRIIKTFKAEGETFTLTKAVPGAVPYMKVNVNRYGTTPAVKTTSLYEVMAQPSNTDGTHMYLVPSHSSTMEELINSYVINKGTDNVFVRSTSASTSNNITRIDLILEESVIIPAAEEGRRKSGFLLMERGGNDNFKIAGITGLSVTDTTAVSFGDLVAVASADWGGTGQNILSVVMQKNESDDNLKPSQYIPSQSISGVFISLNDLGIAPGTVIYGISLMADNVTDPEDFPASVADAQGGLDFMAGGGFFTRAVLIEGKVWNDANGNAVMETSEGGVNNGFWANLTDNTGKVISSVQVKPDGTYSLYIAETNIVVGMEYTVILTNKEYYEDDILLSSDTPGEDYHYTGTHFGGTASPSNNTGIITIGLVVENVSGVDFGINKAPVAEAKNYVVEESAFSAGVPGGSFPELPGYKHIPMSSSDLTGYLTGGSLSGTDNEDCPSPSECQSGTGSTFSIESIYPTTVLYYDFGEGNGPELVDISSGSVSIDNFDVSKMMIYGVLGSGNTGDEIGFTYTITDKAGFKSTAVDYTIISSTPLSIDLMYFDAEIVDNRSVVLIWGTASERQARGFEVERSADSREWQVIGFVNSQSADGNSSAYLEYSYNDRALLTSYNFYRLRLVNLDGSFKYSPIRMLFTGSYDDIIIQPNPTKGDVHLSGLSGSGSINVYDITGRLLSSETVKTSSMKICLDKWGDGIYYIQVIEGNGQIRSYKVVRSL